MRVGLFALALWCGGCQCVTLPDRHYRCEGDDCDDAGVDSGTDAGTDEDAGVDAGGDAGGDAGEEDGGLYCNSWQCVDAHWVIPSDPYAIKFDTARTPLGVTPVGWVGGVLLPDGRVLTVPGEADRFAIFDPRTLTLVPFGRQVGGALFPGPKFSGGVLAPNGRVYAFPDRLKSIVELDFTDGGQRDVGEALSTGFSPAAYRGGVVDAFGNLWLVSSRPDLPVVQFFPDTGLTNFHFVDAGHGWANIVRLPDDQLLLLPTPPGRIYELTPNASLFVMPPVPIEGYALGDAGSFTGASLTREGTACTSGDTVVCISGPSGARVVTPIVEGSLYRAYNCASGNGSVATAPSDDLMMSFISADGGVATRLVPLTGGFGGIVATQQGLVALPAQFDETFAVVTASPQLGGGIYDPRPMRVLLSPYFNKL